MKLALSLENVSTDKSTDYKEARTNVAELTWPSAATAPFWPVDCDPVWTAFAARHVAEPPLLLLLLPLLLLPPLLLFPPLLPPLFPPLFPPPPFRFPLFCRRSSVLVPLCWWTVAASATMARPRRAVTAVFINMLGAYSREAGVPSRKN